MAGNVCYSIKYKINYYKELKKTNKKLISCIKLGDLMGGGATWYRVTLLQKSGENGLYRLESCFISVGSELPENPPYKEGILLTYQGLNTEIGSPFNAISPQILALTEKNPVLEYKPSLRHFAP